MIDEQLNMYLELSRYAGKPRGTVLYSGQSTAAIHLVAARFVWEGLCGVYIGT
jgi:hypothetical protein